METENLTSQALHGHVGTDPQLTATANGTPRLSFRLGVPRRVETADGQWVNTDPHYVTIAMYGKSAERTAASVQKGDQVLALGHLREYEVTDAERGPRVLTEFRASRVGHDLNLSTVEVARGGLTQERLQEMMGPGNQARSGVSTGGTEGGVSAPAATNPPASQGSGAASAWTQAAHNVGVTPTPPPPAPGGLGM